MLGVKIEHRLPYLALKVFYVMRFVQNHVVPLFAAENVLVLQDNLVRCDADVCRSIIDTSGG